MTPDRPPLDPRRLQRAKALVDLAWQDLPRPHRRLLESIGAAQRDVVDRPLRACVDDLLVSSGHAPVAPGHGADLEQALGVWIEPLRVVLIDAGHPALAGLDDRSYEAMRVWAAWHEWGHALSLARATATEIAAGQRLLDLVPPGVRELIRSGGYRLKDYTNEVIAQTYALLMARLRRDETGQPAWLDDEIHDLVKRVWRMERVEPPNGDLEPVEPPKGYVVHDRHSVEKILAVEAELLRSEGIDPAWPGFPEDHERDDEQ